MKQSTSKGKYRLDKSYTWDVKFDESRAKVEGEKYLKEFFDCNKEKALDYLFEYSDPHCSARFSKRGLEEYLSVGRRLYDLLSVEGSAKEYQCFSYRFPQFWLMGARLGSDEETITQHQRNWRAISKVYFTLEYPYFDEEDKDYSEIQSHFFDQGGMQIFEDKNKFRTFIESYPKLWPTYYLCSEELRSDPDIFYGMFKACVTVEKQRYTIILTGHGVRKKGVDISPYYSVCQAYQWCAPSLRNNVALFRSCLELAQRIDADELWVRLCHAVQFSSDEIRGSVDVLIELYTSTKHMFCQEKSDEKKSNGAISSVARNFLLNTSTVICKHSRDKRLYEKVFYCPPKEYNLGKFSSGSVKEDHHFIAKLMDKSICSALVFFVECSLSVRNHGPLIARLLSGYLGLSASKESSPQKGGDKTAVSRGKLHYKDITKDILLEFFKSLGGEIVGSSTALNEPFAKMVESNVLFALEVFNIDPEKFHQNAAFTEALSISVMSTLSSLEGKRLLSLKKVPSFRKNPSITSFEGKVLVRVPRNSSAEDSMREVSVSFPEHVQKVILRFLLKIEDTYFLNVFKSNYWTLGEALLQEYKSEFAYKEVKKGEPLDQEAGVSNWSDDEELLESDSETRLGENDSGASSPFVAHPEKEPMGDGVEELNEEAIGDVSREIESEKGGDGALSDEEGGSEDAILEYSSLFFSSEPLIQQKFESGSGVGASAGGANDSDNEEEAGALSEEEGHFSAFSAFLSSERFEEPESNSGFGASSGGANDSDNEEEAGALPDEKGDFSAFVEAIKKKNIRRMYDLCKANPELLQRVEKTVLHSVEEDGETLAVRAAYEGEKNLVIALCKKDTRLLTDEGGYGSAPIHCLIENGHTELMLALLDEFPVLLTVKTTSGETLAHIAAAYGRTKVLLSVWGRDPGLIRARDQSGETPVGRVVNNGYTNTLLELYRREPSLLDLRDSSGNNLAHKALLADSERREELPFFLMSAYSDLFFMRNKSGDTPLHMLVKIGCRPELFKAILVKGPRLLTVTDVNGSTLIQVAKGKMFDILRALEAKKEREKVCENLHSKEQHEPSCKRLTRDAYTQESSKVSGTMQWLQEEMGPTGGQNNPFSLFDVVVRADEAKKDEQQEAGKKLAV